MKDLIKTLHKHKQTIDNQELYELFAFRIAENQYGKLIVGIAVDDILGSIHTEWVDVCGNYTDKKTNLTAKQIKRNFPNIPLYIGLFEDGKRPMLYGGD